jgi:hypothetical protein
VNQGIFGRISKLLGALVQAGNFNSICVLLILVNYIENRKKSEKCKPNFIGFLVKNNTTFVILAKAVS